MRTVLSVNNFKIEDLKNPANWQLFCCWKERSIGECKQKKKWKELALSDEWKQEYLKSHLQTRLL